ncbi:MAG: hypothetical protein ABI221_03950 [Candidatus Saccharimonadales bacterium]
MLKLRPVGLQRDAFVQRLKDINFRKSLHRQRIKNKRLHRYGAQRLKYNT